MRIYDFVVEMLDGVDLERFDFLPAFIVSFIIILCVCVTFRALITIFTNLSKWRF